MSALTSNEVRGLMEAYQAVYAPQELTEEQVWESAEIWVYECIENGVDFSEYTLDELTEAFLIDYGYLSEDSAGRTGRDFGAGARQLFGQARRAVGGAIKDVAGATLQGYGGTRTTSSNPLARAGNLATRAVTAPLRFGLRAGQGFVTGKGSTPPSRSAAAPTPTPSPARTPAPAPAATTPAAPARRAATTPAAPAKPAGTTKPPATTTPAPATPSAPARPSLSSQVDDLKKMRARSLERQGKPLSAATVAASTKPAFQANSFDLFDVVIGHLLDEGYADTEEAALVIMSNMSEEWRESIIEEVISEEERPFPDEKVKRKQESLRGKGGNSLERRMKMGLARRRNKEAEKTGGSQQDAGKGWYHGR